MDFILYIFFVDSLLSWAVLDQQVRSYSRLIYSLRDVVGYALNANAYPVLKLIQFEASEKFKCLISTRDTLPTNLVVDALVWGCVLINIKLYLLYVVTNPVS